MNSIGAKKRMLLMPADPVYSSLWENIQRKSNIDKLINILWTYMTICATVVIILLLFISPNNAISFQDVAINDIEWGMTADEVSAQKQDKPLDKYLGASGFGTLTYFHADSAKSAYYDEYLVYYFHNDRLFAVTSAIFEPDNTTLEIELEDMRNTNGEPIYENGESHVYYSGNTARKWVLAALDKEMHNANTVSCYAWESENTVFSAINRDHQTDEETNFELTKVFVSKKYFTVNEQTIFELAEESTKEM
jgi:hypothetical protein